GGASKTARRELGGEHPALGRATRMEALAVGSIARKGKQASGLRASQTQGIGHLETVQAQELPSRCRGAKGATEPGDGPATPPHGQRAGGETGPDHQLIPRYYGAQHVTPAGPLTLGYRQSSRDHHGPRVQFGATVVVIQLKTVHHDPST